MRGTTVTAVGTGRPDGRGAARRRRLRRFRSRRAVVAAAVALTALAAVVTVPAGPVDPAGAAAAPGPTVWSAVTLPLAGLTPAAGPSPDVTVAGVSCPLSGACVAVGRYTDASGNVHGLIETLTGGTWSPATAPTGGLTPTASGSAALTGVACTHTQSCTAVGWYVDSAGHRQGLLETVNGSAWVPSTAPTAGLASTPVSLDLTTVACSGPYQCGAFGSATYGDGTTGGVVVTSTSGIWSAADVSPVALIPWPAASPDLRFTASSCPLANGCEGVGSYLTSTGRRQNLVVTQRNAHVYAYAGPTTGLAPPPAPSGSTTLAGVDCPDDTDCVAVGQYASADGTQRGSTSAGAGSAPAGWTSGTLPTAGLSPAPAPAVGTAMGGVSCWAVGACVAAGTYAASGGGSQFTVDTLSGATWTASTVPATGLAGYGSVTVAGISCPAPGQCVMAGTYLDPAGHWQGFVDSQVPARSATPAGGYWEVASDGGIFAFGGAPFLGSTGGLALNAPIVGMAQDPCTGGYWLAASDGGVFGEGAPYLGSIKPKKLAAPIVGIAASQTSPNKCGYWLVAADGGVFAYKAPFLGSMGGTALTRPIVAITADAVTGGYWLVASDGGLFAFDAPFRGSMGGVPLNRPVVGMAPDPATGGYWEVATDGGIFAFGAPFLGSMGGTTLNRPVVGIASDPVLGGYWEAASDGGIFSFAMPFAGSTGNLVLNRPVVAMAADSPLG